MNFSVNSSSALTTNFTNKPFILQRVDPTLVVSWGAALLTVCFIGGTSSFILMLVILRKKSLRDGAGKLIANHLAVMAMSSYISFPASAVMVYGSQILNWNVPLIACKFDRLFFMTTDQILNWIDTAIALNRITALVYPHYYSRMTSNRMTWCILALCWLIGLSVAVPGCFGFAGGYQKNSLGACSYAAAGRIGDTLQALGTWIPLCWTGAAYIFLCIWLNCQGKKPIASESVTKRTKGTTDRARMAVTKLSFTLFFVNTVCYAPVPVMVTGIPKIFFRSAELQLASRLFFPIGYLVVPVRLF